MNKCEECGATGTVRVGTHEVRIKVAERTVRSTLCSFPKCEACGDYEIPSQQLEELERRSALTVLRDCNEVSGAVLKYARKALGLTQQQLGETLGLAAETISRIENDRDRPTMYVLALVGLLERAIVVAAGGDPDFGVEADSEPTPERLSQTG
jgi:DNA-binding XRE family transcriptional regulator